jgi:glutamate/tyrosine decarboxylase-like PLP-dependent enzyme
MTNSSALIDRYALDTSADWLCGDAELYQGLIKTLQIMLRLQDVEQSQPVRSSLQPEQYIDQLDLHLSEHPQELDEVIEHLGEVMRAAPLTAGPRFFNQLFGGRDPAAFCGEIFAVLGNHSVYTYKLAGPMVIIEDLLIQELGELAGLATKDRPCGGIFTPGGSLSNLAAMLCARDHINPEWREHGMINGRIYTSQESHYSVKKGAGIIGLGRANVVMVESDERGLMNPKHLERVIQKDREADLRPMMVVATAGTTVRGAFDPFNDIADLCEREGLWFHVDGAFGGSALLSDQLKHLLSGVERADSLTWDAHKAMGVPLTCSVLLTRDRQSCAQALSENASYLFQADDHLLNPGTRSLQCGRRNDALKLWSAWRYHGHRGWSKRIERSRALALDLASQIEDRPHFHLCEPPPFLNVCFEYIHSEAQLIPDHKLLCRALQLEEKALVGYADFKGRVVIRAAVINPELTRHDLRILLDHIEEVAQDGGEKYSS